MVAIVPTPYPQPPPASHQHPRRRSSNPFRSQRVICLRHEPLHLTQVKRRDFLGPSTASHKLLSDRRAHQRQQFEVDCEEVVLGGVHQSLAIGAGMAVDGHWRHHRKPAGTAGTGHASDLRQDVERHCMNRFVAAVEGIVLANHKMGVVGPAAGWRCRTQWRWRAGGVRTCGCWWEEPGESRR